jgi:hypothetical protein
MDVLQGDPLALFLFFVIAEGLSLMMAKLVLLGYFGGFLVLDSQAMVSHLHNVWRICGG